LVIEATLFLSITMIHDIETRQTIWQNWN
jgi:hypothetical protein